MRDPRRLTGLLLIAGGLLWALVATTDLDATVLVSGVGIAFVGVYLTTRQYGLLVPGGILSGLGGGLVVATQGGPDAAVVLGLGLGFLAITVIDRLLGDGDATWWPLIPGGILTVIGAFRIAGIRDIGIYLVPTALIVVGLLLLRPSRDRSDPMSGSATAASDDRADPPAASDHRDERQ